MRAPEASVHEASLGTAPHFSRTRLHISPFNESLLPVIISSDLLKSASNISYHTLQTSPDADYGFIDIPSAEVKKLKSKFHGLILRGIKVRVEEARPSKRKGAMKDDQVSGPREDQRSAASRSFIREDSLFPAISLPNGRRVQRGWADSSSAKGAGKRMEGVKPSGPRSNAVGQCLFRTKLPPNMVPIKTAPEAKHSRRATEDTLRKYAVVREFSSTTKYSSFLKQEGPRKHQKVVSEFVEGKGWVDEDGHVVETLNSSQQRRLQGELLPVELLSLEMANVDECRGSNGQNSKEIEKDLQPVPGRIKADIDTDLSRLEDEPEAENEQSLSEAPDRQLNTSKPSQTALGTKLDSSVAPAVSVRRSSRCTNEPVSPLATTSVPILAVTVPTVPNTPTLANTLEGREVHPLESIFKKPPIQAKKRSAPKLKIETETPFSFFEQDTDATSVDHMPQTPFTQRDMEYRGARSAAPTPDTAAPGKSFKLLWAEDDDSEAQETKGVGSDNEESIPNKAVQNEVPSSEMIDALIPENQSGEKSFEETFWERRGETNRAWKRRRRETGKFKRKMENKRLSTRNA